MSTFNASISSLVQATYLIITPPQREASAEDENAFLASVGQRLANQRRAAILLGLMAWNSFLFWDIHHALSDPSLTRFLEPLVALRLTGSLVLVVACLLSLRPAFSSNERYASGLILSGNAACALLSGLPMAFMPHPFDMVYSIGIMLNITFAFSVLRMLARPTIYQMALNGLIAVACLYGDHLNKADLAGHDPTYLFKLGSLILVFAITGYCVGNLTERSLREAFQRERQLLLKNNLLAGHNEEIERLNRAMTLTSSELTRKTQALEQAQVSLQQTTERQIREKSMFLATAVHDLRQPIQAITSALEPARRALEKGHPDEARELVNLASEAARIMREQLSAILEISWLESGFKIAKIQPVNLSGLLEKIATQTTLTANAQHIRFDAKLPPDVDLLVDSDPEFLSRILQNIISNGIRHRRNQPGHQPFVEVRAQALGDSVQIEIEDNGRGILPQHIASGDIFKHFWQQARAPKNAENGVGLGLSIVKAMVQQLPDHQLSVRSEPDQGTTFSLSLPLSTAARSLPPAPGLESDIGSPWSNPLANRYILFFEDDELVRRAISASLISQGAICESFDSLAQYLAVESEIERTPDLVLADHQLEGEHTARDAYNLIVKRFDTVPLIVLTGAPIELSIYASIAPCSLLRKPISTPDLIAAIVTALQPPV